ncbi:MAG: sugar phosphate isomerase/epimerase [Planctomycetota bacterium]|nr:sugar phosphate isomerase/epimerase [Planctomycetota bacterium]
MPAIVSCFTNSYGRFGARAAIENIRDAGLEYIELGIRTDGVTPFFQDEPLLTDASDAAAIHAVQRLLEQHDVKLSSCNVTSGNPLDDAVVEITKLKLNVAAELGVTKVVGGAGEVEVDDAETELPVLYGHLRDIGDHAGRLGITYCFETHPGVCQSTSGMLETMRVLNHPHLKLNFDTGNLLYYNEFANAEIGLAKVCHHVAHLHLKDSMGEYGKWYFPALGSGGAVDFVRTLDLMKVCGFTGPYSIEIEGIAGEPELTLEQTQQRIRDSVQTLRECGYFD